MFIFTKSYDAAWRVFVPTTLDETIHHHMKNHSIWGGHDKVEFFEGVECLGYEFKDIGCASDVVRGCSFYYR